MGLKLNTASSGSVSLEPANTASNYTVTIPAGTGTAAIQGVSTNIVSGTAVASTSGTSIDFTGIPSWVKRITVMFNGVSKSGTADLLIQSGSGSIENTGYISTATFTNDAASIIGASSTIGYRLSANTQAATNLYGSVTLTNINSNLWIESGVLSSGTTATYQSAGSKSFGGVIDRIRITTTNGTDTFDAGTINILYE